VSVETGTRDNLTIVDGLTALSDKPAAAAQGGASGQWQELQPAGPPPAPPEAHIKGVSASNDLWKGGLARLPRSSHLTRSGGLCPADPPPGRGKEAPSESSTGGSRLQPSHHAPGHHVPRAVRAKRPCPSHGLTAAPTAHSTSHTPTRTGRPVVGTPKALACLSLRAGEGLRPCSFVPRENLCAVPPNRDAVSSARNQGAN
jgi:hypothetical protein